MFVVIIRMAFKYDLLTLFELVEARPCLWNKKVESYKNKNCRENSWQEVFAYLDETYEDQSQEEKKKTGTMIITKWANIRDAFIRSLKTTNGRSPKKNYIYAEHLQFLLGSHRHNETDINILYVDDTESNEFEPQKRFLEIDSSDPMPAKKNKKAKKEFTEKGLKLKPKEESFFVSFYSYISDMSEGEKLDLHMDILKSIKDIKNRRLNTPSTHEQTVYMSDNDLKPIIIRNYKNS